MKKNKYNLKLVIFLTLIPLAGIFGTFWHLWNYGIVWQEPALFVFFWIFTGLGITVGYHRLFSHRSFKAHTILEWLLAISGAAALENSALKWCSDHRRHHKQLDTDKDPYSITKGFFHAHIGWILEDNPDLIDKVKDLEAKAAIRFQYKYYVPLFAVFGIVLPVALGALWGRPLGALFWGVLLRITLVHHFTYFINSLCHYIGKKPYDHKSTSRDTWYISFLTFGEGFHNYHHKFQWDYRNGIRWFDFDPSKWLIWGLSKIGLAKELKKANYLQIMKVRSIVMLNQIYSRMEKMPEHAAQSYQTKIEDLIKKIKTLEQAWQRAEKDIQSIKLFQKQKKQYQLEYHAIIKALSVMLVAVQNGQL